MLRTGVRLLCISLLLRMLYFSSNPLGVVLAEEATDPPLSVAPAIEIRETNGWRVVSTPNFLIRSSLDHAQSRELGERCEALRTQLLRQWLGEAVFVTTWTPRCEVLVHAHQTAYNSALGRHGDSSGGSTILNFDQDRIVVRRIDLRADGENWRTGALPHEMTHVVLAERFGKGRLPRWADEGLAMLSESPTKQRQRMAALQADLQQGHVFQIEDLLQVNRLPAPHLRNAFYSQSVWLSSHLLAEADSETLVRFLHDSHSQGAESALQQHYGLKNISELQDRWENWTRNPTADLPHVHLANQIQSATVAERDE